MAVTSTPIVADVAIVYDNAGKALVRRFSDVKVDATDADVYDVLNGTAGVATLQTMNVAMIQRRATSELENV